jgi:hypothetical protein
VVWLYEVNKKLPELMMEWNGIFTNFPDSSTKPGFVSNYTTTFDVHQNGWSTIGGI